ncbi:hypothetical protein [Archangium violaceum]|uniref:Uncharacterized protein n=1 Tax=Archangium violaceum Cb vi76 TaxID=1406225 RepID=A0A084SKL7_9BACT|nr:hypothetical protein [Archangium violaceum]KFA89002.1 hypothetical protein Q664_37705 [Archangium violaceum Cb vi76]
MSQPKPSTVLLILAVVACVALYVLGVGLGAQVRSPGGGSSVSQEERVRWRERFIKPPRVAEEDLSATDCTLTGGTVRVVRGRECQVAIARSDERVRTVNVEPLSGSRVDVRLVPVGGAAVPARLEGVDERRELDVPEEGATLTLTCTVAARNTSECPVRLR